MNKTYDVDWKWMRWEFYWYDWNTEHLWADWGYKIKDFENSPTEITLEQWNNAMVEDLQQNIDRQLSIISDIHFNWITEQKLEALHTLWEQEQIFLNHK